MNGLRYIAAVVDDGMPVLEERPQTLEIVLVYVVGQRAVA